MSQSLRFLSSVSTSNNDTQNYELVIICICWIAVAAFCASALCCFNLTCYREHYSDISQVESQVEADLFAARNEVYEKKYGAPPSAVRNDMGFVEDGECIPYCKSVEFAFSCSPVFMRCPFCNEVFRFDSPTECRCNFSVDVYKMAIFAQSSYFPKVERNFFRCFRSQKEREHVSKVIEMLCGASVVTEFSKNGWDIMPSISLLLNSVLCGTLNVKFIDLSGDINSCALFAILVNGLRDSIKRSPHLAPSGFTLEQPFLVPKIKITDQDRELRRFQVTEFVRKFLALYDRFLWIIVKYMSEGISDVQWNGLTDTTFATMTRNGWSIVKPIQLLRKSPKDINLERLTSDIDANSAAVIEVLCIMLQRRGSGNIWHGFFCCPTLPDIYVTKGTPTTRTRAKRIEMSEGKRPIPDIDDLLREENSSDNESEGVLMVVEQMRRVHTPMARIEKNFTSDLAASTSSNSSGEKFAEQKVEKVNPKKIKKSALKDIISESMKKYGVEHREIFAGVWMKMKFGNDPSFRTR